MTVATLLDRAAGGDRLDVAGALHLLLEAPLPDLMAAADSRRRACVPGGHVTYLVDRNINYTNVCVTDCKFCEFYRPPGHPEAFVLDREALRRKIDETVAAGGTRILLQGGHNPGLSLPWHEDLLAFIRRDFPDLDIDGYSPSEIDQLAVLSGLPAGDVVDRLAAAGLTGVPGAGAEILDDAVRRIVSPKKISVARWFEIMGEADARGLVTTVTQVIGFGETTDQRLAALLATRGHQDRALAAGRTGFIAFYMWPLQFESRFGHVFGERKGLHLGASEPEYLRHLAICRLFLDNIVHVGASWPTMGPDIAARALSGGADDFGSTMLEENVVSAAGSIHCSLTEGEIVSRIRSAGFLPVKRDSRYRKVPPAGCRRPLTAADPPPGA